MAAFGLRMNAGWPLVEFAHRTGFRLCEEWKMEIQQLVGLGYAQLEPDFFRLTSRGLRYADWAAEQFLRIELLRQRWKRGQGLTRLFGMFLLNLHQGALCHRINRFLGDPATPGASVCARRVSEWSSDLNWAESLPLKIIALKWSGASARARHGASAKTRGRSRWTTASGNGCGRIRNSISSGKVWRWGAGDGGRSSFDPDFFERKNHFVPRAFDFYLAVLGNAEHLQKIL